MPDYFTLAELNALPNMSEGRFTNDRKEAAAAFVVSVIEREVGTSFVPRTVTEVHDGGTSEIVLRQAYVLSITSASVGGVAVTDPLRSTSGILYRSSTAGGSPNCWLVGTGNVSVTYQAGYSAEPPADIKEAALQATRWRLIATASNSDLNARQTSLTSDMGGTIQFSTAGPERPTGYPDIDAVIIGWRDRLWLPSFA